MMHVPVLRLRSTGAMGVVLALAVSLLALTGPAEAGRRPAPTGLQVTAQQGSLTVRWHRVRHAPGYKVRWSLRHSMRGSQRLAVTRHRAQIGNLAPDTRYYVQVAVAKRKGRGHRISPWSRIVSRRTPPPPCPTMGNLGDPTPVVPTTASTDLRVASFNIRTINLDSANHPEQQWLSRADRVASLLLGAQTTRNAPTAAPDVIALQEANQSYGEFAARCTNQMIDLRNRLNADGTHHYEATSLSPSASVGTRILFDTNRLRLESAGSVLLAPATTTHPHLAWAIFQDRSNGRRFFFGSVHLVPSEPADSNDVRAWEWDKLLAVLPGLSQGLPVVLGGDFNSVRSGANANTTAFTYLPQMADAGFADTLLGSTPKFADRTLAVKEARPDETTNANCWSHNRFVAAQRCEDSTLIGQQIDYLFASNALTVKKWEMVLDLDGANNWIAPIPSDHNLIRATVTLPGSTG